MTSMMYVDCHTHLTNSIATDVYQAHESIRICSLAVGTDELQILSGGDSSPSTHRTDFKPSRYYSIGLHPMILPDDVLNHTEVDSFGIAVDGYINTMNKLIGRLQSKSASNRIVAIGEIGFDTRSVLSMQFQRILFDKQVALAELFSLPIVIHCVRAFDELISAYSEHSTKISKSDVNIKYGEGKSGSTAWVVHGYTKSQELAQALYSRGMYLSFGSAVLKASSGLKNALTVMPSSHLLLETDTYTGAIDDIYYHTAVHRNIPLEELRRSVLENVTKVFDIDFG